MTWAALVLTAGTGHAAIARFRYVPVDQAGNTAMQPVCPHAPGEYITWFGAGREPYRCQPRPNRMVTFCHPYTGRNITLPLALPLGTPIIQHRWSGITYNYGSYTVGVEFLPDGSADVTYNSGFFRGL